MSVHFQQPRGGGASLIMLGNDLRLEQPDFAAGNQTFLQIITGLSLTTNLEVVLDAGDSASYTSGQSWLDRSGNGFDFFLGATSGSEASDPTFNGSAGGLSASEYWSFDGGDRFTYDTTNETWMQNLHKDNAIFSWAIWAYLGASGQQGLFGTAGGIGGTNIGVGVYINSSTNYRFRASGGAVAMEMTHSAAIGTAGWHFFGGAVNEATGANGARMVYDGSAEQFTSTYTAPSASSASQTMGIASTGGTSNALLSGGRMAMAAFWEGTALTSTNLTDIYDATKGRFGL